MSGEPASGQDPAGAAQNSEFFASDGYGELVTTLDSYHLIRAAITKEVSGAEKLLDVGNGGVFEYDTGAVGSITAVDLFLDQLPESHFPPNVTARRGDALALEENAGSYDAVLEAFLYHHLAGAKPADTVTNTRQALAEAAKALKPGGRLIVAESCVPRWFYAVERVMFAPLRLLAKTPLLGGHPAILQLPLDRLVELVGEQLEVERSYRIPTGRWLTQFGRRWPTALTPARPYMVVARKPGNPAA
jgi:SAM-dependent methyltransferase